MTGPAADFSAEYFATVGNIERCHRDRMAGAGVPHAMLRGAAGAQAWGIGRVNLAGETYCLDSAGSEAVIMPIARYREEYEPEIWDLIAWEFDNPGRWYFRYGLCSILPADAVDRAVHFKKPLVLHASPLDWLRAGGIGGVILRWDTSAKCALRCMPKIVATDDQLARKVEAFVSHRDGPEIRVIERPTDAAA